MTKRFSPRQLAILASLVAVLCYVVARLGGALIVRPQLVSPLWLGNVALVAVLLLTPQRIWKVLLPAGLCGFLAFDLQAGEPIRSVGWFLLSNAAEVLTAAWFLHKSFSGVPRLNTVTALARYWCYAVLLAPVVGACFGALSTHGNYWASWKLAFFSEALGFLIFLPALLVWVREIQSWSRKAPMYYIENAALFLGLIVLGHLAFSAPGDNSHPELLYSLVPLLLWSALRFGTTGVSSSIVAVAFLSIWEAVHGRGPFTEVGAAINVSSLQLFLFVTAAPFMTLAVLVEESRNAERVVRQRDLELNEAQRLAQTGSWQWDPVTDRVIWSAELYRLAGYDSRLPAPSFQNHKRFFTRESWERLKQGVEKTLHTGVPYELDLEALRSDGTKLWVTTRGEAVLDGSGHPIYLRGTTQNITERKRSEEALAAMSGRLITAQEEERTRIARELHDDLNQRMAVVQIGIEEFAEGSSGLSFEAKQRLHNLAEIISDVSSDLHGLSHQLHPATLEILGLVTSLKRVCTEFSAQHNLDVQFVYKDIPEEISSDVTLCLLRIVQEGLRNIVKHSGAATGQIELFGFGGEIHLCISDSGCGFNMESAKDAPGLGLVSMRERLRLVGGQLSIESQSTFGTRIRVRIPKNAVSGRLESEASRISSGPSVR
ncbi:MAG TPA: MASE1 domain-containing protein [Candidatus Eisenbacteria bacterium]|nr:MASE1 domain-containing protein [Candidatus Eisenbacteria bacterium]